MATVLLAPAATDLASSSFTLAKDETAILLLVGTGETPPTAGFVKVQFQRAGGTTWADQYTLSAPYSLNAVVTGPGVFRVYRPGQGGAVLGVERAS